LKNKLLREKPYSQLIRKMFFQTLLILVAAIVLVFLIRSIGRGYFADAIVQIIMTFFQVDWYDASSFYNFYIRHNIDNIIMVTILVFFVTLFRFSLSWFTRYFDQIVVGVNQLANDEKEKIIMSPELSFVEDKLNQAKDELARRAQAKQEAEQRKNELVVYLAHDIKTPLTSVIGYLSLLDEAPDMPTKQKAKYVHITLEKAYRLEQLINEFFEITRYNFQSIQLTKKTIDLYYMLLQIADEAYPKLEESGKRVQIFADEDITIYGDSDKLARVFNNILKNAIAYSSDGSTINISAEIKDYATVIQFENAGSIPQEKLESIFEKFYRLDDARSSATGGAGLGLAIAKDILTLHGGTIEAQSGNSHTVFLITLPNAPSS